MIAHFASLLAQKPVAQYCFWFVLCCNWKQINEVHFLYSQALIKQYFSLTFKWRLRQHYDMHYFCVYFHRMGECLLLGKSEHTCQNVFCLSDNDHVGYHLL